MKKITKLVLAFIFTAFSLQTASAARSSMANNNSAGLGFDIIGSYYMPTDSRFQGIGTGIALNIKLDEGFTMGYRTEEMNVRGEDGIVATTNSVVHLQGITAYFRTLDTESLAIDFGMWLGAATTSNLTYSGGMTSPFLEPLGRITYTSAGKLETHVVVGVGYRFIRRFNTRTPFGAGYDQMKNFDGLDINFGVGVMF
ncbi:MAG: hypothetical protein COT18_10255 [Elusimicrobia bacterium CG08_land_8_20_14_0_20_59_10]|nr:MAG: hypothetical protein COT18_10255 [Elusimicrobia bacterium CG08_land_8_20_14_0_20_59_10]